MPTFFDALATIEYFTFGTGLIINAFLLYCIFYRTQHDLGAYKNMQVIYVFIDIAYALAQVLIGERFVSQNQVFVLLGVNAIANSRVVICAFIALYGLTYLMIDFNFLYRLWALKSPSRLQLFSQKWFIMLLLLITMIFIAVWGWLCYIFFIPTEHGRLKMREIVMEKYGIDTITHGLLMGDYFHADGTRNLWLMIGIGIAFSILAVCSAFMFYAAATIVYYLKTIKNISEKTLQLQRHLFILLCAQTVVPLIILYSPCLINVGFPMLKLDAEWNADVTALSLSFYLPLDGLAIIYFMKDYRKAAISVVTCGRHMENKAMHSVMSVTSVAIPPT